MGALTSVSVLAKDFTEEFSGALVARIVEQLLGCQTARNIGTPKHIKRLELCDGAEG